MKNFKFVGVALRPATLEQVAKLAAVSGQSRTSYLRYLIENALLNAARNLAPDIARILTQQEYQTLLLDHIVRQRNPEGAAQFAQAAEDLTKKHHGA